MDTIISFLEKLVHYSAELGIVLAELAGIAILIITAVKGVASYFKHDEHLRLELAQGIALALEFKLGGEVLRTVIVREWTELLILGAVIALRGVLTLLLHWEIKVEEEHDERLLKLKAMEPHWPHRYWYSPRKLPEHPVRSGCIPPVYAPSPGQKPHRRMP